MKRKYKIADINIELILPFSYGDLKEYKSYWTDDEKTDITIEFKYGSYEIPKTEDSMEEEYNRITQTKEGQIFELIGADIESIYGCMVLPKGEKHRFTCYLNEKARENLPHATQVFKAISLEYLLNCYHTYILHASYIHWKGMGILFSGPSGSGKSTQARLWQTYEEAEIINGDRVAVRKDGMHIKGYGLPYAGSSGVFKNITTNLGAIVIVRHGKENKMKELSKAQAFRYLFEETIVHTWDKEYQERITDALIETVNQVPVYFLECKPEREAVNMVKGKLEKEYAIS